MIENKYMISFYDKEFLIRWKNKFYIIEDLMNKKLKYRSYEFCFNKLEGSFILEIRFYNIIVSIRITRGEYEKSSSEEIFNKIRNYIDYEIRKIYYI